jgi:hypothetical protein
MVRLARSYVNESSAVLCLAFITQQNEMKRYSTVFYRSPRYGFDKYLTEMEILTDSGLMEEVVVQITYHNSGYYPSSCLLFETHLCRFVRASDEINYLIWGVCILLRV